MKFPIVSFYVVKLDDDHPDTYGCQIDRGDGYVCTARGDTPAEALLRASLLLANREKQEFNRAEHEKEEASKRDYSMNAVRYSAKRKSPLVLIDTDTLLDIQLALGQMRPVIQQLQHANEDYENQINPKLRSLLDGVDFMTPKKPTSAKPVKRNGKGVR